MSSTFRDMHGEREILRREVFPIIQRVCEERGVSFFDIDLRWGVTKEEADGGLVLSICLEEIDRCRPFVLAIIGGRYGWVDPDASLVVGRDERFQPLRPYTDRSVTELEIRYAILNRPENAPEPRALVYRRPAGHHNDPVGFEPLVGALRDAGVPLRSTPDDVAGFAQQAASDLLELVKSWLPPRPVTASERARARSRGVAVALGHRFVDLPSAAEVLSHVRCHASRIAIVGPPGSGKSMIAAALVRALERGDVPGAGFVAAISPAGWANWSDAFQELILQIQDSDSNAAPPVRENRRHTALDEMLAAVAERRFVVAVIDGIDERHISGSPIPAWCPDPVANASIVVTFRGDAGMSKALSGTGWVVVELGALTQPDAVALSEKYFAPLGRRLSKDQLEALTSRQRRPLEFALILEELKFVGRFEDLPDTVARLSGISELSALLEIVVERLERDHGRPVMAVLEALALAPDGLGENVLRLLAGEADEPLVQRTFALLRKAIEGLAAVAADRVTLRSPLLSELILRRLPDDAASVRRAIVGRLRGHLEVAGAAEEMLRQLLVLEHWQEMAAALADRIVFDSLTRRARQQMRAYWAALKRADPNRSPAVYRAWIGTDPPRRLAEAALLAEELGVPDIAVELAKDALERGRGGDAAAFALAATVLAADAERAGDFVAAIGLLQALDAPEIGAEVPQACAVAALRRARIMLARADDQTARRDLERASEHIGRIGDERLHAVHQAMEGAVSLKASRLREARATFDDLVALGDRLGDLAVLASAQIGLAKVARAQGKLDRAAAAAASGIRFARILGDDRLLQDALGIKAKVHIERADLDAALVSIRERLEVTRKIRDVIGELETEVDHARVYSQLSFTSDGERIMASVRARAALFGLAVPQSVN